MRPADIHPGAPFDPSPLSRARPALATAAPVVVAPAVLLHGVAFVPVPGQPGPPGAAATTLPWGSITDKPDLDPHWEVVQW